MLRSMVTISGRATSMSARSGGQVLKQESRPERRHSDTAWVVLTKLRVNLGLSLLRLAQRGDRAFVKIRGGTRLTHSHTPHAVVARLSGRTV